MTSQPEAFRTMRIGFLIHKWVDDGHLQSLEEHFRRLDLHERLGNCSSDELSEFMEYMAANCSYDGLERFFSTHQWRDESPHSQESILESHPSNLDQHESQLGGSTMDGNNPGQGLHESNLECHESDTDIDMCRADECEPDAYIGEFRIVDESPINGELDIDIDEDESDYEGEDTPEELTPINDIILGTESTTYSWHYPVAHMTWVKRVWSALDPNLPEIARDAAAMILLADRKKGCTLSPVFKFLNQQAKLKMQSMEAYRIPRLYLAILQAMALCDDEAKSNIYKLVPSLKPKEHSSGSYRDLLAYRGTWHWGSSTSMVEIFPTHPPRGHERPYVSLSLTDDFKWPIDWAMDWDSESSKGERICFEKITPHWEAHLTINSRETDPVSYISRVSVREGGNSQGPTMVPHGMSASCIERYMDMMQSAVKYQTLKGQLKLMINNGNINGDSVDNLLKQVEGI